MDNSKENILNLTIQDLNSKVDIVYRHGMLQEEYSRRVRDYGEGHWMTENEAHTLSYICDNEAVTVTHLADAFFRTKGTSSKILSKLEEKGLIMRQQKADNRKWIYFVPTEEGRHVNEIHRSYDRLNTMIMLEALMKECTMEEIESFYKVTALRVKYLEQKHEKVSQ